MDVEIFRQEKSSKGITSVSYEAVISDKSQEIATFTLNCDTEQKALSQLLATISRLYETFIESDE